LSRLKGGIRPCRIEPFNDAGYGIFEKLSVGFSKMAMRLVSRSTFSLPSPSFTESLKSGKSAWLSCWLAAARGAMIYLLILSSISGLPFRVGDHGFEIGLIGDGDGCVGNACVLSLTYLMKSSERT
jgi:hypothetical protein